MIHFVMRQVRDQAVALRSGSSFQIAKATMEGHGQRFANSGLLELAPFTQGQRRMAGMNLGTRCAGEGA